MSQAPEGHYISFILQIKEGILDDGFHGRVLTADGREVDLADGAYSVRVWMDGKVNVVRGTIRHEGTAQELHFQSGDRVSDFIRSCLTSDTTLDLDQLIGPVSD